MANKKKNINIPDGLIDYYVLYGINRNENTKNVRKNLLQKQGEIRSNMANGSLNSPEILNKLQEAFEEIAKAVKTFKNDERRKEYDIILDAAYKAGKINIETQKVAQELYEELQAMFMRGNYRGVIKRCMEGLNNNIRDYRIYILLAQSYFSLNEIERALSVVDNGLQVHPNNMTLLKAGARFSNEGKQDYDKAQRYINQMMETDSESPLAISEQGYLYMKMGKKDLAYQLIDDYVEKHPDDTKFRKDVAYDLVGYSYSCYTKAPQGTAYVIASEEDYHECMDSCDKAMSLYNDENVRDALNYTKTFGKVMFNDENKESIFWLFFGGIMYLLGGIIFLIGIISGMDKGETPLNAIITISVLFILGGLIIFSAIRLLKLSYRPYWQIYKFILTGKREKGETKYIVIGKIFTGYIKWGLKLGGRLVRFCIHLGMR